MREHLNALAVQADWVLPGLAEGRLIAAEQSPAGIARFDRARGLQSVVLKLGDEGAWVASPEFEGRLPGVKVARVVDTVGAGNGFAAGLISAQREGLSWQSAASRGNWVGAQAVQVGATIDGLPLRSALPPDRQAACQERSGRGDTPCVSPKRPSLVT